MENFDYKAMEALVLEQLKSGKPLLGKGRAFTPLLEKLLNAALEDEMDAYMDADERSLGNRSNGYRSKQVKTGMGEVTVHTHRDRDSRFEPRFIKKTRAHFGRQRFRPYHRSVCLGDRPLTVF